MFKNLFIKSKKIISLFTIIGSISALTYVLSQDIFFKKLSPTNEFKVENVKDIEKEKNKIITKEYIDYLTKDFNKKLDINNKDIAIITMDIISMPKHTENVKGIIDTLIKNFQDSIDSFYLPYEVNKNTILKEFNYIESITNNIKNKIIFVNESFANYIDFNPKESFSFDSLIKFNKQIFDIKDNNNKLLNLLKANPNIALNKSAGNYIDSDNLSNRKELLEIFNKLTNNNYKLTKELIQFLNLIIKTKIENNIINDSTLINKEILLKEEKIENKSLNINLKRFLDDFQELCKLKKIDYDKVISLHIKDYLVHYQKLDLLEKLNTKENKEVLNDLNNPFKLKQITIIEAIDLNTIKDNIKIYKEYHKDIDINKLEKEIKDLNISNYKNYSLEDINKLEILYNSYKDNYPEIFLFSKFGTLSNLMYKDNDVLKTSIDGHNASGLDPSVGTSFAAPNYLGHYINEYIKKYSNNIKDIFINFYNQNDYKIKDLDE